MNRASKPRHGRRRFLRRFALGAAGLAGLSEAGLYGERLSNRRLRAALARLAEQRDPAPLPPGLQDFPGVIHVHGDISPNSHGTPAEILAAARRAGLRFLMTTDYNDRRIFTQGMQGHYGDILVVRGAEIIRQGQSVLAINIKSFIDSERLRMSMPAIVSQIKSQGGLAFVAHPWRFTHWDIEGLDGLETYDIADAAYVNAWKAPAMLADILTPGAEHPEDVFLRGPLEPPPRSYLRRWDEMNRRRRFVGIAGNDAHENVRVLGRQLDPYAVDFRFVQNHVLAPVLETVPLVDALRAGHAYYSFGMLADATGFQFYAADGTPRGIMGDHVARTGGMRLHVRAPLAGAIDLIRDGRSVQRAYADRLDYPLAVDGVYRVEVGLVIDGGHYPWIVSNPIHVG